MTSTSRKLSIVLLSISLIGLAILLLVPLIWAVLYFGVYLGYGNYKVRGHQEFASNCVSKIEPARQMDRVFADCRHYIAYGPNDVSLFTSVAYFGGRYVLTMQVPVAIDSAISGTMIGKPQFCLNEIRTVTISPQIGASFSRQLDFGSAEWQKVYGADGDFRTIGFAMNTVPVANFQKYAAACRPSN